ncbi:MAG: transaldolase family protein [Synergistaceae bacterium]|nr:transaldolase family protein [Synergistaceae bacterium]
MLRFGLFSLSVPAARGDEEYVPRVMDTELCAEEYMSLRDAVKFIGVTEGFRDVLSDFPTPEGGTPAGFRRDLVMAPDGVLRVDLRRDISRDRNGVPRPTNVLYSADSADPYEVRHVAPFIANLTCNPAIIYDAFINNPKANAGGRFKTRDEVMSEIAAILGPGCDISVELNNPFESDFGVLLEEAERFRHMLGKYRAVIKVPHTGPVNAGNVGQLMEGDRKLEVGCDRVRTSDGMRGHTLALRLREHGFRVNFTLMFEPYQTQLALQARPYFINAFMRQRLAQSSKIRGFVESYDSTGSAGHLEELRSYLISSDFWPPSRLADPPRDALLFARDLLKYRRFDDGEGMDGLDAMRHSLRALRNCNMPDTRLIVCSMDGPNNYPDIDKLLCEPEFSDMNGRVVITAAPEYLARFTSSNLVIAYQRKFMNAAKGRS